MFELIVWGKGRRWQVLFEDEEEMMKAAARMRAEGFKTSVAFISYFVGQREAA